MLIDHSISRVLSIVVGSLLLLVLVWEEACRLLDLLRLVVLSTEPVEVAHILILPVVSASRLHELLLLLFLPQEVDDLGLEHVELGLDILLSSLIEVIVLSSLPFEVASRLLLLLKVLHQLPLFLPLLG